jgi:hypothetical protein
MRPGYGFADKREYDILVLPLYGSRVRAACGKREFLVHSGNNRTISVRNEGKTRNTGTAALQIRLLGVPQITYHGVPVTGLTSAKAQGLLFYVAVTGRMHTRTALAALLWGDVPEAAARSNLRKALQQLRRHLGDCGCQEQPAQGAAATAAASRGLSDHRA